jgi:hypothetical protein
MGMTKGPELLKVWDNWEAGMGYPVEDGTPGMYTAEKILGMRGELRPAPAPTTVTVTADPGHHFQYFFEEPVTAGQTPTFDAAGAGGTDSSASTLSFSHVVANQENRLLLAFFASLGDTEPPTSVVFNGTETFTRLSTTNLVGVVGQASTWYLVSPTVTTANIVATWASDRTSVVGLSSSWYKVDQSGPLGEYAIANGDDDGGPVTVDVTSNTSEVVVDFVTSHDTVAVLTKDASQTLIDDETVGDLRAGSSYETGSPTTTMSWTLGAGVTDWETFAVSLVGAQPGPSYLYAQRGKKSGSSSTVKVNKVSLANADFANLETGNHDLTPLTIPGQPVRYQGYWWFPMGDNQKARRLQTIGSGAVANDTLDATATALGADHFANLGFQVISTLAHSANDAGGVRILKKDGDIGTEADWGSAFQVGDRSERAGGVSGLGGASFVLSVEGLYSFNQTGRSGLVFEDYRMWRHVFDNMPLQAYRGGLIISHPTGLVYYIPGQPPVNIGLDANILAATVTPSGPTDLFGGRYHGVAAAGDIIYAVYQPDLSSTSALVLVGYPGGQGFLWQGLSTTTLADADHMLGCFVSVSSKPRSAEYVTPTLWYGNSDDLDYKVLSNNGSPFRPRADTHVVETSGDVYLPELTFPIPHKLSHFVVYAEDMTSGDEWQLSGIVNAGADVNAGAPVLANERAERFLGQTDVRRFMPHINWTATSSSARVPPTIKRIELYGWPE